MGDVIDGKFRTTGKVPVNTVLDGAREVGLADVVVVGVTEDGTGFVNWSSDDLAQVNWMLDIAKKSLLDD